MNYEFEHFGISVSDIEKAVDCYRNYFGFEIIREFDKPELGLRGVLLKLGNNKLELVQPYSYKSNNLLGKLLQIERSHVAVNVQDFRAAYDTLKESSSIITEIIDDRFFFCETQEGIIVEVRKKQE